MTTVAKSSDVHSISAMQRKTVLLLGAGASCASDFALPSMAGFFVGRNAHQEAMSFLQWFYPNRSPDQYNLEEVPSHRAPLERVQRNVEIPATLANMRREPRLLRSIAGQGAFVRQDSDRTRVPAPDSEAAHRVERRVGERQVAKLIPGAEKEEQWRRQA
jgi:hypothetical protein